MKILKMNPGRFFSLFFLWSMSRGEGNGKLGWRKEISTQIDKNISLKPC